MGAYHRCRTVVSERWHQEASQQKWATLSPPIPFAIFLHRIVLPMGATWACKRIGLSIPVAQIGLAGAMPSHHWLRSRHR